MSDLDAEHARFAEMTAAAADIANRAKMAADLGYIGHTTAVAMLCDQFRTQYGVPASVVALAIDPLPAPPEAFAADTAPATASAPKRDPDKPSEARQDDIISVIRGKGTPLARSEIVKALRMPTDGKIGHNLAWMVKHGVLLKRPPHGYWPAGDPM